MNKGIVVYPDCELYKHYDFYKVKVKSVSDGEWINVPVYQAKVDMHDVRETAFINVDFDEPVVFEISFSRFFSVYDVQVRPSTKNFLCSHTEKKIEIRLDNPTNLSVEINKDKFHNLHIFSAVPISFENEPDYVIEGSFLRPSTIGDGNNSTFIKNDNRVRIKKGFYYISEGCWHLPSNITLEIETGTIIKGSLICDHVENVNIVGNAIVDLSAVERFTGTNGCRVSHSKNIRIEGLTFVNPPHYTCMLGGSKNIFIKNIKSFSCEGWSDGIDIMSCEGVYVEGGFIRTSDDCVAVYGSRWDYFGDSKNISIKNISLWADVAHPMMMGTHGDAAKGGDTISNIVFENIDVLEHHEFQENYLGVMAVNAGDGNKIHDVLFKDIRVDAFEHGRLIDIKVMFNKDYNAIPGGCIRDITFENISLKTGDGEESSLIVGYDKDAFVENITIKNYYRDGALVDSSENGNIIVGDYASDIKFII